MKRTGTLLVATAAAMFSVGLLVGCGNTGGGKEVEGRSNQVGAPQTPETQVQAQQQQQANQMAEQMRQQQGGPTPPGPGPQPGGQIPAGQPGAGGR